MIDSYGVIEFDNFMLSIPGVVFVLTAYGFFLWFGYKVAKKRKKRFVAGEVVLIGGSLMAIFTWFLMSMGWWICVPI